MRKIIIILCCVFWSNSFFGQINFEEIKNQIHNLSDKTEIEKYWLEIYNSDQENNGGSVEHSKETDILNLYKTSVLIETFGYPTVKEFVYPAYTTPWVVWVHCYYPSLSKATFSVILEGEKLNQIPQKFFPNYFVGGYLLNCYGFDMEFDRSFDLDGNLIENTLQELSKTSQSIEKIEEHINDYFQNKNSKISQTLGSWEFLQHEEKQTFKIVKLENQKWLLVLSRENSNTERFLEIKNNNKKFEVVGGFDLFYFKINENNRLEIIRTKDNKTIKISI